VIAVRRASASRLVAIGLVAVIMAATSVLLISEPDRGAYRLLALMLVSFAALGLLLGLEPVRRSLTMGGVLVASGALLLGSALAPARASDDLWLYAIAGRAIVAHHENPYVHPAEDFPDDPISERVNPWYRGMSPLYGPVFVSMTAGVAAVAGDHPLPTRLAYQMLAAVAVFIALVLIGRHTRSPAAVAAVGLNVVTTYIIVNSGHVDPLVGLAVLGGVLLAMRRRHLPATLAFTAAALIKVTAGLALVAYLAWLAYQRGPRAALRAAAVAGGVALVFVLPFGVGNVMSPLSEARPAVVPQSPWTVFAPGGFTNMFGYGYNADYDGLGHLATLANVTIVVVAAVFVASRIRDKTPVYLVAGALLAYLFVSTYTAPWYAAWVLPVLALNLRSRVSLCALGFFAVVAIDDRFGAAVIRDTFWHEHSIQVLLANWINTLAIVAAVVATVVLVLSRRSEPPSDVGTEAEMDYMRPRR